MTSATSVANRTSLLALPLAGIAATFCTLLVRYEIDVADSAKTAVSIALDTYMWIAVIAGLILLVCDIAFPRRKKLVLGFSIACVLLVTTFWWMIGESLMHV